MSKYNPEPIEPPRTDPAWVFGGTPPKPKRSYRVNTRGKVVGYEGRQRVVEFGSHPWSERWAQEWVKGVELKEGLEAVLLNSK
jgi:hypothetical protein